jgi:hypothetical protein
MNIMLFNHCQLNLKTTKIALVETGIWAKRVPLILSNTLKHIDGPMKYDCNLSCRSTIVRVEDLIDSKLREQK